MRNVLVTGGAGFIGGHLVRRLVADGLSVTVLDDLSSGKRDTVPDGVTFIRASILDVEAIRSAIAAADACVHLAAIASVAVCNEAWAKAHAVNLTGFLNILEALQGRDGPAVPLIYASSAAVYGASQELPLAESALAQPLSPYGADKYGCELHARAALEVFGQGSTGFRFFNVYGPGQDPSSPYSGVISLFADRLKRGEAVRVFGDGMQTRDFVYVGDVVEALVAALNAPQEGVSVYNVCAGGEATIRDLALAMGQAFGVEAHIEHGPGRDGEVRYSRGDPSGLREGLGVSARVPLAEGLKMLADSLG